MPRLYMLIGLPGCGKTTWRAANEQKLEFVTAASDDYIEIIAKDQGKTYNEVFSEAIKSADLYVDSITHTAVKNDINVCWDQTNLSKNVRKNRLAKFPPDWEKIAVYFPIPDGEEWKRRLDRPGKTIPQYVINSMAGKLEVPTLDEGFSQIWFIKENEEVVVTS